MSFANIQMYLSAQPEVDIDEEEIEKEQEKKDTEDLAEFFSKATF